MRNEEITVAAQRVRLPVRMRVGDGAEREIGTVEINQNEATADVAAGRVAEVLESAAAHLRDKAAPVHDRAVRAPRRDR